MTILEERARAVSKRHAQAVDAALAMDWRVVDVDDDRIEFSIHERGGERFVVVQPDHLALCAGFHGAQE